MPPRIKLLLSLLVLAAGAGVFTFEQSFGNTTPAYVAAGLAVFMVIAVWLFPEASKK